MKKLFVIVTTICLTTTSFAMPPKEGMNLSPTERSGLVKFIRQCDINSRNLKSTQAALKTCQDGRVGIELWQTPVGVVSIGFGALIVGLVVGRNL